MDFTALHISPVSEKVGDKAHVFTKEILFTFILTTERFSASGGIPLRKRF